MVKNRLTPLLRFIKQASPTLEDYCTALFFVLNRGSALGETRETLDHDLNMAITILHNDFLYHPDMADFFPNFYDQDDRKAANQPLRLNVHHFILDMVFKELRQYDMNLIDEISSSYKEKCPSSYAKSRIGEIKIEDNPVINKRKDAPKDEHKVVDEDDDDIPAWVLEDTEDPIDELENLKKAPNTPTINQAIDIALVGILTGDDEGINGALINDLLDKGAEIASILSSALLDGSPQKEWVINHIVSHPQMIKSNKEFIALLKLLTAKEIETLLRAMPEDKLLAFTDNHKYLNALRKQIKTVNILTILIERFPDHYIFLFRQLNATALTVNEEIDIQTLTVINKLNDLHKSLAGDDLEGLAQVTEAVRLTEGLLRSTPENRAELVEAYKAQALIAGNRPSTFWRMASIAMMGLGLLIAAIGTICIFTGVGTAPGIAIAASGAALFTVSTATFFSQRRCKTVQENMLDFADSIEKEAGDLLRPA